MKKLCLAIFSLFIQTAYALPVGNPYEASFFYHKENYCEEMCLDQCSIGDFFQIGIGFYGDYVFNRHMETVRNKDIDTTKLFTNAGYLVISFCERVDLFSALGVSRLSLNTSLGAFNSADPHPLFELESESSFSYSIGGRATLLEYGCASLGFVGQYFATEPDVKRMYIAAGAVSYPDDSFRTRYSEWQVALGLSYRYNCFFVPYAALKYAHSYWKLANGQRVAIETNLNNFLFNLRNQRNWGYVVGLTLCPLVCEKMAITVEARFPDEKALYVNAQMRF